MSMVTLEALRAEKREEILRLAARHGARTVKDDRLYLHHMLEHCQRITRFISPGRERFIAVMRISPESRKARGPAPR